jgi:hypothetical protein
MAQIGLNSTFYAIFLFADVFVSIADPAPQALLVITATG